MEVKPYRSVIVCNTISLWWDNATNISISAGDQDVDPGCCHVSALLGSQVLILLVYNPPWWPHLCHQICHGDAAQDGDPAVHRYCLLDQVPCYNVFHLVNFSFCRVVLFLLPFIHAIGKAIIILMRLTTYYVFFSQPSDLCCHEQAVQELSHEGSHSKSKGSEAEKICYNPS